MTYATLDEAKRALKANDVSATDDDRLYTYLLQITDRLDGMLWGRYGFEPVYDAVQFRVEAHMVDQWNGRLALPYPLLSYTSMTINGTAVGATSADTGDYDPPYRALYLTDDTLDCGYTWYSVACPCTTRRLRAIVTGFWGWHTDYENAWQLSGDTIQDVGGINATDTTITVTDADGEDYRSLTPRFSMGNLIRIGTEYLRVDEVNTTTNILTVRRGVNGTTAAAHAADTAIYVYYPDDRVMRGVSRQAGLMYARRGAYDGRSSDGMGGETVYPQDMMGELRDIIQEYQYL
jgi:hypothetical protein